LSEKHKTSIYSELASSLSVQPNTTLLTQQNFINKKSLELFICQQKRTGSSGRHLRTNHSAPRYSFQKSCLERNAHQSIRAGEKTTSETKRWEPTNIEMLAVTSYQNL